MGLATIASLQSGHNRQVFVCLFQQATMLRRSDTTPGRVANRPKQQLQTVQFRHQQGIATGRRDGIVQLVVEPAGQIDKPQSTQITGGEQPPKLPGKVVEQLGRDTSTRPPDSLAFEGATDMDEVDQVTRPHPANHGPPIGTQFHHSNPREG